MARKHSTTTTATTLPRDPQGGYAGKLDSIPQGNIPVGTQKSKVTNNAQVKPKPNTTRDDAPMTAPRSEAILRNSPYSRLKELIMGAIIRFVETLKLEEKTQQSNERNSYRKWLINKIRRFLLKFFSKIAGSELLFSWEKTEKSDEKEKNNSSEVNSESSTANKLTLEKYESILIEMLQRHEQAAHDELNERHAEELTKELTNQFMSSGLSLNKDQQTKLNKKLKKVISKRANTTYEKVDQILRDQDPEHSALKQSTEQKQAHLYLMNQINVLGVLNRVLSNKHGKFKGAINAVNEKYNKSVMEQHQSKHTALSETFNETRKLLHDLVAPRPAPTSAENKKDNESEQSVASANNTPIPAPQLSNEEQASHGLAPRPIPTNTVEPPANKNPIPIPTPSFASTVDANDTPEKNSDLINQIKAFGFLKRQRPNVSIRALVNEVNGVDPVPAAEQSLNQIAARTQQSLQPTGSRANNTKSHTPVEQPRGKLAPQRLFSPTQINPASTAVALMDGATLPTPKPGPRAAPAA